MTQPPSDLEPAALRAARYRIDRVFLDSPQYVHDGLSARLGVPVIVKLETANPIRSFKGRGTWLAVRDLVEEGRAGPDRPVVCVSAGNFGQGVAYAARAFGVEAVVFTSLHAAPAKVERMRALGARVVAAGEDFDAARGASESYAAAERATLLVDGQAPLVAAGAGTLAVEVTDAVGARALPAPVVASVPVGNGSLVIGVGSWLRHAAPGCRIVGVQAEGAPAMALSFRAGRPIDTERATTYADGIATRIALPEAVALLAGRVDEMVLVPDEALRAAQAELTEALGVTVEGSAAASWAGLLAGPPPDGPALVIVTGSNAGTAAAG